MKDTDIPKQKKNLIRGDVQVKALYNLQKFGCVTIYVNFETKNEFGT